MKYAVLGDIHSNLTALEAVLGAVRDNEVDCILSVGDVVGYGAAPSDCIRLLRESDAIVVMGNHDAAVVGELDTFFFNQHAKAAVEWTRQAISGEEMAWLTCLPHTWEDEFVSLAHGSYNKPEDFNYVQTPADADASLELIERPVCFIGHTHVPVCMLRYADDPLRTGYTMDPEVDLKDAIVALVNAGSVGQPRDDDPQTGYVLYDSDTQIVTFRRIPYDIEREVHRIRSAGLPSVLAERLYLGV
ncbi:MAG: metallophosphatase family protein [Planctomycetes bacterium]|nr:metallophosphatase family protein [Planctomycetota bacterium]